MATAPSRSVPNNNPRTPTGASVSRWPKRASRMPAVSRPLSISVEPPMDRYAGSGLYPGSSHL
jgi:hypothetical protein